MHPLYSIPNFVTSALIISLGVFVVLKKPKEKINWLFGLLTWSVAHWLFCYALVYCSTDPLQALRFSRTAYLGVVFIPTFFLHFMSEFLHLRHRAMFLIPYAISIFFLYVIWQDYFISGVYVYFWGYYSKAGPLYWPWLIYFYAGFAICDYQFIKAYLTVRRSSGASLRAKQLKYVLWANCVASISIMDYLPKYGIEMYPCAYLAGLGWLLLMAYAIVRFRLMDVQLVIRKTLIYSFVSALLTGIYFAVVTLATHLSSGMIGKSSWVSIAAAGIIVTIIFLPIFRWVQAFIDRFFFRFRIDRETRLMELTSKISQQESTEHLTQSLCETIDETLHPKCLGLYLQTARDRHYLDVAGWRIPKEWERILPERNPWASYFAKDPRPLLRDSLESEGTNGSPAHVEMLRAEVHAALPLMSRDEVLGFLLLGEKRSEESYTAEDLILLRIITNQATVAFERPRVIREVSGGFAHEIKTPLSKISLPAELTYLEIERALKEQGDADEFLENIMRRMRFIMDQAKLAGQKVDALQELGASENKFVEMRDWTALINTCLGSLEDTVQLARVSVVMDIPANLPAIMADAEQLEILFTNLLKNAVEAVAELPSGKVRAIKIRVWEENGSLLVSVADSGPGIRSEDRERVFQPHYTTKGANGLGMGLFLCRQSGQRYGLFRLG